MMICDKCGHPFECPHCSSKKQENKLRWVKGYQKTHTGQRNLGEE